MRRLVQSTLLMLLCTSCSLFGGTHSDSLEIHSPRGDSFQVTEIGSSPFVYRVASSSDSAPGYITAIRDCNQGKKSTEKATTRQILIGFDDLRIRRQEAVTIADHHGLASAVEATYDGTPIDLYFYSIKESTCVVDLVLWRPVGQRDSRATVPALDAAATEFLENILSNLLE